MHPPLPGRSSVCIAPFISGAGNRVLPPLAQWAFPLLAVLALWIPAPARAGAAPPTAGVWRQLDAPLPRSGHAAVYDPIRRRMLVIGGNVPSFAPETWALDLVAPESWRPLEVTNAPSLSDVQAA